MPSPIDDLFAAAPAEPIALVADVWLLSGRAHALPFISDIDAMLAHTSLRGMSVPGGRQMSVQMTNCGDYGWVSDAHGYGYRDTDPLTGRPWPPMPPRWRGFAERAAAELGWRDFKPDACVVNCYRHGASLGLHQDRDERDFTQPIVSVSLGASCRFQLGGLRRRDPVRRIELRHGDVLVWGGAARLIYHGVAPMRALDPRMPLRYNLTFRRAR